MAHDMIFVVCGKVVCSTTNSNSKPFEFSYKERKAIDALVLALNVKLQPHEGDNLDERIVTISCKRVYGATQARLCGTSGCSRLRYTVKVSNKMRLFRSHEQLRYPAKKTVLVVIGRRCKRRRFRWGFPPVANGQENVCCSLKISLIRNSLTIQPVNSPSCG